jgi:hypothetical protein
MAPMPTGPGAKDPDAAARVEANETVACGNPRRQLIAKQAEFGRRDVREDGDAVLLVDDHQLAEAADARFAVHRRAVGHLGERRKIIAA